MKKLLKKQISKLVSILVLTLSTTSCNYLDVIPDNIPTIDMAFADRAAAEKYLFTCYSYLPNFYHPDNDPAMLGSGEIHIFDGGGIDRVTALRVPLSHSSYSFAPICQPVRMAFA